MYKLNILFMYLTFSTNITKCNVVVHQIMLKLQQPDQIVCNPNRLLFHYCHACKLLNKILLHASLVSTAFFFYKFIIYLFFCARVSTTLLKFGLTFETSILGYLVTSLKVRNFNAQEIGLAYTEYDAEFSSTRSML